MRQSQKNNRARNSKNSRKQNVPSVNRVYESSGPEGKVRGTPQQIIDKYLSLSRDKQTSGDRILAENFLQHAEHYVRILSAAQSVQQQRRDEREEREEEAASDQSSDEAERATQPAANGAARGGDLTDGMAVIGDENPAVGFAEPNEPFNGQRRGTRRGDAAGDEESDAPRRKPRRPSRRSRSAEDDSAQTTESAEKAKPHEGEGADGSWPGNGEVADLSN